MSRVLINSLSHVDRTLRRFVSRRNQGGPTASEWIYSRAPIVGLLHCCRDPYLRMLLHEALACGLARVMHGVELSSVMLAPDGEVNASQSIPRHGQRL